MTASAIQATGETGLGMKPKKRGCSLRMRWANICVARSIADWRGCGFDWGDGEVADGGDLGWACDIYDCVR